VAGYILGKIHIDLLVTAAIDYLPADTRPDPDTLGRRLWAANLATVAARYPHDVSGERPGPVDFRDEHVDAYVWKPVPGDLDPVTVIKAIDCYRNQSCGYADWLDGEQQALCSRLHDTILTALGRKPGRASRPYLVGYDAAPWEFTNRQHFVPQAAADCSYRDDVGHDHDECLERIAEHAAELAARAATR
jgi:hypothetical protein